MCGECFLQKQRIKPIGWRLKAIFEYESRDIGNGIVQREQTRIVRIARASTHTHTHTHLTNEEEV